MDFYPLGVKISGFKQFIMLYLAHPHCIAAYYRITVVQAGNVAQLPEKNFNYLQDSIILFYLRRAGW